MKKLLLLFILITITFPVLAEELPDITNDIEIKTKWYQEKEVGQYHPKGEDLPGYIENPDKITYSSYSGYSSENCLLPTENYAISKMHLYQYKIVTYTKYIKLTNFEYSDNIAFFYKGKKENFTVTFNENNEVILEFLTALSTEYLLFFIDYEKPYNITLYFDKELTKVALSKDINGKKVLIPDKTWITDKTNFYTTSSTTSFGDNNGLITYMGSGDMCKVKRIYTYRYKMDKVYYDDEYHTYVENYLPDMTDIKVYYKGEELIKTVEVPVYEKIIEYVTKYQTIEVPKEIIKTVEIPKEIIKTVEVCSETENTENNYNSYGCSQNTTELECPEQVVTEIQYCDQIKEVITIPKYLYLIIFSLLLIIIILVIWLIKKYVIR